MQLFVPSGVMNHSRLCTDQYSADDVFDSRSTVCGKFRRVFVEYYQITHPWGYRSYTAALAPPRALRTQSSTRWRDYARFALARIIFIHRQRVYFERGAMNRTLSVHLLSFLP